MGLLLRSWQRGERRRIQTLADLADRFTSHETASMRHRGLFLICGFFMLMGGVFHFSRAASLIVGGLVLLIAGCISAANVRSVE